MARVGAPNRNRGIAPLAARGFLVDRGALSANNPGVTLMTAEFDAAALLDDLVTRAAKAGADAADAIYVEGNSVEISQRLKAPERVERSEGRDLGLRVFIGKSQAIVSSTDFSAKALGELVERAVAMARATPPDPHIGLADPDQLATEFPDFDTLDPIEPTAEALKERAAIAEEAALAISGVSNSEGASASWGRNRVVLAATNGFRGGYAGTSHGVSVSVLAGDGTSMERDYDWWSCAHASELPDPATLGRNAGERAVRRLNPRRLVTGAMPILFDPRVSGGLLGHLASAISGPSVARGTSFLKDFLGKPLFGPHVTITDDPTRRRGRRSRAFDAEGLPCRRRAIIDGGVLTSWIMDLRSARQLGLTSTGHAYRGTSSPPGPGVSNFYMEAGAVTPAELMADIRAGFYVTELMGMGVNGVTGDYSRGAAGFFIDNGELAFPVSEVTIAGNLKEMFRRLTPACDLVFRTGVDAPTVRVDGMTVAGA